MRAKFKASPNLLRALERLKAGDHLCLIYENAEEQLSAAIPFMRIGLERGEKCVYIADDNTAGAVLEAMTREEIDTGDVIRSGAFTIASKKDAYLKQGRFDPEWMINFLKEATQSAVAEGYSALRVTGEMTWALGGDPGSERLIEYEARLNDFFPESRALAICQYNKKRFPAQIILDVIKTHPLVIYGGVVMDNVYYTPPEEFFHPDQIEWEVERQLGMLVTRQRAETSYKMLFENSPDGIVVIDCGTARHLEFNDKAYQQLGYTRDEFQRLTVADYEAVENREKISAHIEKVLDKEIDTFETKHRRKDGELRNVLVTAKRLEWDSQTILLCIYRDITELRRADEALHESERRFKEALENVDLIAVQLDSDGNAIFANDFLLGLTGWRREEVMGRNWFDLFIPQDTREDVKEAFAGIISGKGEAIAHYQNPIITKTGETRIIAWSNTVSRSPSGKIIGTTSIGEDITDRKQAENDLRESENKFRALAEKSLVGVYIIQEGIFKYVNPKLAEIFGYTTGELIEKMGPEGLVFSEDWPTVRENLRKRVENGVDSISYDFRGRTKTGETIHVEVFGSRMEFHGRPAVVGTLLDITERLRAQKALRESERKLSALMGNLPGMAYSCRNDENWTMEFVSEGCADLTGYRPEDLVGNRNISYVGIIHPDDRAAVWDSVQKALEEKKPFQLNYRIRTAFGEEKWVWERGAGVISNEGELVELEGFVTDVTDLKLAEEELRRYAKELERSNRELQQFAYIASHDLQEPLRMVASYLQLIQNRYKGRLDEDADEFIEFAVDGARRMKSMIEGLLSYSRVETRGGDFKPLDFNEALGLALKNLQSAIEESEAVITCDVLPLLQADPTQIIQLFQNLIGNAVKFRGAEPPRIHVSARQEKGEWVFSVKDNGMGLNPKHKDKIFQIFQRLNRKSESPGAGIGLALCRRIVERHGGNIWVDSTPGEGAEFCFSIPDNRKGA